MNHQIMGNSELIERITTFGRVKKMRIGRWFKNRFRWVCGTPDEYPFVWSALKGAVIGVPSVVLTYVTATFAVQLPGQASILDFLLKAPYAITILIVSPIPLVIAVDWFESYCSSKVGVEEPDKDEFTVILRCIETIVATKSTLVDAAALKVKSKQETPEAALQSIVRPVDQIRVICAELYNCLREISSSSDLKVVMVPYVNGVPRIEGSTFFPISSAQTTDVLSEDKARKTLFAETARTKNPQVIPDLETYFHEVAKNRRIYLFRDDKPEVGSIMCFPVVMAIPGIEPKSVYAISILTRQPNKFNSSNLRKYSVIFDYFSRRILMEYSLRLILNPPAP